MKRRELFSSLVSPFKKDVQKQEVIIRPPYYLRKNDSGENTIESDFHKSCILCDDKNCAAVCEEQIIIIQEDGTPKLDFKNSGCTYCDECAIACPTDVLKVEHKQNINAIFSIDMSKCLSWQQTMCFSCKDPCLDDAISFAGMFFPEIQDDKCTSCGFCVKVCPTEAVTYKIKDEED